MQRPCGNVREWVEGNIQFSHETSPNAPGPVSLARQPWMEEILQCFLDPTIEEVVLVMGTQTGKTTLMLLGTAAVIEHDPAPLIWAAPTDDLSKKIVLDRLVPLIRSNECLNRQLRQDEKIKRGKIPLSSMTVYYTGAQVPARLASVPAAFVFMDEAAKYEHLRKNEAHPIKLLRERTKSFARKLVVEASTPNTEENFFWRQYLATDQRKYFVPCPHCGKMQELEFGQKTVVWDPDENGNVTEASVMETARYVCAHCGEPWTEHQKQDALQRGEWRATAKGAPKNRRGYHLNSLYSAYVSTGEMAAEFYRASHDTIFAADLLQNFWNSWLALPWRTYAVRTDEDVVHELISPNYRRGEIPVEDYHYIIVAYDPGESMTHWVATLIGERGEMWVIDWGTLASFETVPEENRIGALGHLTSLSWGNVRPDVGYIDSGDWTMRVYQECDKGAAGTLVPCKGTDARTGAWSLVPVKVVPGLNLVTYVDYTAKSDLYGDIIAKKTGQLHLPNDADADLLAGLTGQQLERVGAHWRWKSIPNDHYGDCIKLARVSWWRNYNQFEPEPTP